METPRATTVPVPAGRLPATTIRVATPQPGIVKEVAVKPGQSVNKGDLILRLDDAQAAARTETVGLILKVHRKEIDGFRLRLKEAETAFALSSEQFKSGVANETTVADARANMIGMKSAIEKGVAELAVAEAEYRQSRIALMQFRILAPADGTIQSIAAHPGEYVTPTSPVAVLRLNTPTKIVE